MIRMFLVAVATLIAALVGLADHAEASVDDAAYAAFVAGDYAKSETLALAADGADNFALAARAVNSIAYFDKDRKRSLKTAGRALAHAEAALKIDPRHVQGRVQAAISLGLRGGRMSPARVIVSGVTERARRELDEALKIAPNDPWALTTSAAWRVEVERRGGKRYFRGADAVKGYEEFRRARAADPGNVLVAYECSLRLIAFGRADWLPDALAALDVAATSPPQSAFERELQSRAQALKRAYSAGPEATLAFLEGLARGEIVAPSAG